MGKWTYKEYYQKHKREISLKRRRRYKVNRYYREQVKEKALDYYHTHKKKPFEVDRRIMEAPSGERLLTIGRVADLIRRDILSVRRYHRQGFVPEPTHFDTRGWRLYTMDQASAMQLAFRAFDRRELKNLKAVAAFLKKRWKK